MCVTLTESSLTWVECRHAFPPLLFEWSRYMADSADDNDCALVKLRAHDEDKTTATSNRATALVEQVRFVKCGFSPPCLSV